MERSYALQPGSRFPPGATLVCGGVNFCVFCRHATELELLLYAGPDSPEPFQIISLTPETNRTFFFWHVLVEGLPVHCYYAWRAHGPHHLPQISDEFAGRRELVDPRARAVSDRLWNRQRSADPADTGHTALRAIVTEPIRTPYVPK